MKNYSPNKTSKHCVAKEKGRTQSARCTTVGSSRKQGLLFAVCMVCMALLCLPTVAYEGPTMGWSSWNTFYSNISESTIKGQASAMVNNGFKKAGYTYINIDDGYQGGRNKNTGELLIHPSRFPNGLQPVVKHIHSLGLKAGIYSDAGRNTCANYYGGDVLSVDVGFKDYEERDAKFFFDTLDFDFIKVDFCGGTSYQNSNHEDYDPEERYTAIYNAMLKCEKKDIRYNVCRWAHPGTWVHDIATSWRISQDINASWGSVKDIIGQSLYLSAYCSEGHYNDMDMLEVGRGLSTEEDKTHFGMWCIMASPLLIGCDLTKTSTTTRSLLQNADLIAINQDSLGLQAYVVQHVGETYILAKDVEELNGLKRAVAFYNPSDAEVEMTLYLADIDLGGKVQVRDLFGKKSAGVAEGVWTVKVPAHGTRIYTMLAEKRYERTLYEAETGYNQRYQETQNNSWYHSCTYDASSNASGGALVGYLGMQPDNDLQWRHVYSKEGGEYTLTLSYASGENRKLIMSVNGTDVLNKTLNSGGFGTTKTVSVTTTLQPGDNVVRAYTDTETWMPNVDYLKVEKNNSNELVSKELDILVAKLKSAAELSLTQCVKENITSLLGEIQRTDLTSADSTALVTNMQKALTTATSITSTCSEFEKWWENAQTNADNSQESEALTALQEKMDGAQTAYNAANNTTKVNSALSTLKTALKNYLKADSAQPSEDKTLDMTLLLTNPDFTLSSGWQGSPSYANGVGTVSNKNFNVYQTLTNMKPGVYTITAQAFYRVGENNSGSDYKSKKEVIPARFYAKTDSVAIRSLYSYTVTSTAKISADDLLNNYANTSTAAATLFTQKRYTNKVTTTLTEKGSLKIGFVSTKHETNNWCCFDDIHITYAALPEETSIELPTKTTDTQSNHQEIYDLQGRKASHKQRGIVIKNGKKIITSNVK